MYQVRYLKDGRWLLLAVCRNQDEAARAVTRHKRLAPKKQIQVIHKEPTS